MLIVVTADQRGSRRAVDAVPEGLALLNTPPRTSSPFRPFERTAGDEIQGVLGGAEDAVHTVERLLRTRRWSIGIGIGTTEQPLPRSTRAGRGPAFVHARHAVEVAKNNPGRLAVCADDADSATRLETVLMLWADLLDRRTPGGWEVADLLAEGLTHHQVARRIGVSQSAVSQRASTAGITVSARARNLAVDLVAAMTTGSS